MSLDTDTNSDADITAVFDSLVSTGKMPGEDAAPTEEPTNEPDVDPSPGSAADGGGEPVQSGDAGADSRSGVEPAAGEPPVAADDQLSAPAASDPDADAILQRLSRLVKETPEPKGEQPPAPAAPEPVPELYSPDETTFLTEYEKDWADVSRGEALKRRAEYRELASYLFSEIGKVVGPLRETLGVIAERTHLADIKGAVPDYSDTLRDQVLSWVDSQPAYLKAAYGQVVQQGTPDEVSDLITRFRAETGQAAPAAQAPAPAVTPVNKSAAAALAPVPSKRTNPVAGDDPNDVDAAWKKWTEEFKSAR